jgi:translation initiation factor IF-2
MSEDRTQRLGQVARKLNVGISTVVDFLTKKGFEVENNPNFKIIGEQIDLLAKEFKSSALEKEEASHLSIGKRHHETFTIEAESEAKEEKKQESVIESKKPEPAKPSVPAKEEPGAEKVSVEAPVLPGIKVLGKIDLNAPKPTPKKEEAKPQATEEPKETPVAEQPSAPAPQAAKPQVAEETVTQPQAAAPSDVKETSKSAEATSETIQPKVEVEIEKTPEAPEDQVIAAKADALKGLTVLGKIELPDDRFKKRDKPVASSDERNKDKKKRLRKRIDKKGPETPDPNRPKPADQGTGGKPRPQGQPFQGKGRPASPQVARTQKAEPTQKEIQDQIKQTLARLQGGKSGGGKSKRRDKKADRYKEEMEGADDTKILRVTEFISANDLASLMDVSVNEVISTCLSLGMFVSINQRLDAEAITIIADEFGYEIEFSKPDEEIEPEELEDDEADLLPRAPIVTIMGHVDHGKTSLLDYIRRTKVTAGEAGGITQHIGAYDVTTSDGQKIAFLDTPGHEAFTAMRARGAKITDVAIIVIAADDSIMPQTKEAINHAQVAGVPMIFAINKIDKPNANPNKIKEELANMNLLVEEWGGKYQSQDISAKTGVGVDELLEKVLLEAEILELKANPDRNALGTVIEASLDKGRGYVTTVMVQAGTLEVGNIMLAGPHYGRVKAMFDHTGKKLKKAGPSTPVLVLGLAGAPQAGDTFKVVETEREAREIANSREQILREQTMRTKKHITLDEIGRRLAIGSFKELNIIIKGDVDGSVEALSDSLLKLSKEEVSVNIIHKGVGQISESDVLLASASDAIILGFNVRPSPNAKKLAEQEEIEIRHYSIIYDAINQIKDAIEGMLEPEFEEIITGNVQVREVFKISKIGTVAGCYVTEGHITRKNKIRIIRDGIVVHDGEIDQLKRFKDDVSEVKAGYECGISIKNFNNIQVDDTIEGYMMQEIKKKK